MARHRQTAVRAVAVFAAVDRGAARAGGDARLAEDCHRASFSQSRLDRPQLPVDVAESAQLCEDQRVIALAEAVQVVDEAAEIAVGELTCPS
jgi:hypothetical protein